MELTLVVMAAGIGSRYGGLKQLDKLGPGGEILLEYAVFDALKAGFKKIIFVVQKNTEGLFREFINGRVNSRADVVYVHQGPDSCLPKDCQVNSDRKKPWGTGHAVLVARKYVSGPFAVINADDYYGPSAFKMLAKFLKKESKKNRPHYCLVGYPLKKTLSAFGSVSRGVCQTDAKNNLTVLEEHPCIERTRDGQILEFKDDGRIIPLSGDEQVSLNAWGFFPDFFTFLDKKFSAFIHAYGNDSSVEFHLPKVVNDAIQEGVTGVQVLPVDEPWFGMTHKEDRKKVVSEICKRVELGFYPKRLWGERS